MKRLLLILVLFMVFMIPTESYAQSGHGVTKFRTGKTYSINALVAHDGVIYRAVIKNNNEPPTADWTIVTGSLGGDANLGYTASPTNGVVTSSTGTDATLTLATLVNAGLLSPANFEKLSYLAITQNVDADQMEIDIANALASASAANVTADANEVDITSIELLTNWIAVTQNVDLDQMETDITTLLSASFIGEAPIDGNEYTRKNSGWTLATAGAGGDDTSTFVEKPGVLTGTDRLIGHSTGIDFGETISGIPLSIFNDDLTHTTDTNTQLAIATFSEVNTGTDNTKAISPLALASSQLQTDVTANNAKVTDDDLGVSEVYAVGWDGDFDSPTKNDVYDKIETIAGGDSTTASNGLTEVGNDVQLGGELTSDVLIYAGSQQLSMDFGAGITNNDITAVAIDSTNISLFAGWDENSIAFDMFTGGGADLGYIEQSIESGTGWKAMTMNFTDWTITDTHSSKGMIYAGDYSANYVPRSIVDKAYVDGVVGSSTLVGLTDVTITTPSVGQHLEYNGSIWVNAAPASGGDDVSAFAEKTGALVGTDRLVGLSGAVDFNETISGIPLSIFNDDLGHVEDDDTGVAEVYDATGWDADTDSPQKNDVRDKFVSVDATASALSTLATTNFNTNTTQGDSLVVHNTRINTNLTNITKNVDSLAVHRTDINSNTNNKLSMLNEDTNPQLGGDLQASGFDLDGVDNIQFEAGDGTSQIIGNAGLALADDHMRAQWFPGYVYYKWYDFSTTTLFDIMYVGWDGVTAPVNTNAVIDASVSNKILVTKDWVETNYTVFGGLLNSLTDVTISAPSTGQHLEYNGSIWVNATPASGGDDVSAFAEKTGALVGTDRLVGLSTATDFNETISGIPLSIFNDDLTHTVDTGILDIVEDVTPTLGGNLDVAGNSITDAGATDLTLSKSGSGDLVLTNVGSGDILIDGTNFATLASNVTTNNAKVTNATHTGDVTGATALTIAVDAVDIPMLSAGGIAGVTTYLRGDNVWATPAGGGDVLKVGTPANNYIGVWTGDGTLEGEQNFQFNSVNSTLNINAVADEAIISFNSTDTFIWDDANAIISMPEDTSITDLTVTAIKGSTTGLTGTSLSINSAIGKYYNMTTPSSATVFTFVTAQIGGWAKCKISGGASEPTVTSATKIAGATWTSSPMYLVVAHNGTTTEYFFLEI